MFFCELINLFSHHSDDQFGVGMRFPRSAIISEVNNVLPFLDGIGVYDLSGRVEWKNAACILGLHAIIYHISIA